MINVIPFDKELLKDFVYDGVEIKLSGQQIIPMVEFYNKFGTIYMGMAGGKVLGVGGIYPLWNGTGGAFLFLNKEAQSHKISIFKVLVQYMNELIKKYGIKTLIAECINDSLKAHKLIAHLGFVKDKEIKMSIYYKNTGS